MERAEYQRAYRAANRERIKAQKAAYYAEHRQDKALRAAGYYASNRDSIRERAAVMREARRPEIRALERARYAVNPWRSALLAHGAARHKAHKLGLATIGLSKEVFARLHLLPCAYCGVTPANGADHIVPLSRGGPNSIENLAPACLPCNVRKGIKTVAEFSITPKLDVAQ